MSEKTFLTIDKLINNIKSKNINIKNENNVRNILETNNYYFIMGYKFAFKNNDGTYKDNTSFEDIYSLYIFDKMLKLIVLDPILEIEQVRAFYIVKKLFLCKTQHRLVYINVSRHLIGSLIELFSLLFKENSKDKHFARAVSDRFPFLRAVESPC